MNKIPLLVLALAIGLLPNLLHAQNIESKVDSLYKVQDNEPGFSVAVFRNDEIILEKQYGSANLDYDIPITHETVFDIGSIAKQFTAFGILLLEQQGKLSIKDPAYTYIPKLPRYKNGDPTIEHLLNQTSGIREVDGIAGVADFGRNDFLTQSQMMNFITKSNTLNFKPGEYFQYTNSNYILLADIIATVSGTSFTEFMNDSVFKPFGMDNTIKKSSTYTVIKNRAIGYIEDEGNFYKAHLHAFVYNGDGQILTTARDMFKWHMGLKEVAINHPELYKKMHTKAKLNNGSRINYGLGVEFETHNGYIAYGFDGMILGGFVSKYLYFHELDIAFFTTQNTFDSDFDERFFQFVDLYISSIGSYIEWEESEDHTQVVLSENELTSYEGDYLFLGNDVEEIKMNSIKRTGKNLSVLTTDGEVITELTPIGNHQFLFNDKLVEFTVTPNAKTYSYHNSNNELPWLFKQYTPFTYTSNDLKEYEGQYFSVDYQISKKVELHDDRLYVYGRNGAWADEIEPLAKDVFDYSSTALEFLRDEHQKIIGLNIMGIEFKRI